jgi:glycine dehydrogenase
MITYPSTHGVYEHDVSTSRRPCTAGGQVYVDGANMNALVGFARFGDLGGDVSHLNLHKTFAIPHGGGGPASAGRGEGAPRAVPAVTRWRSARARGRLRLRRRSDLRGAVRLGIHPADLVGVHPHDGRRRPARRDGGGGPRGELHRRAPARALSGAVLGERAGWRTSASSTCAAQGGDRDHRRRRGQAPDRLRLPRPTMSFPVAGTLMVEPTESEDLGELERFVEAMIQIRRRRPRSPGRLAGRRQPARARAAHRGLAPGEWDHAYSRELAAYPTHALIAGKYWPPVRASTTLRRPQPGVRLPARGGVRAVVEPDEEPSSTPRNPLPGVSSFRSPVNNG